MNIINKNKYTILSKISKFSFVIILFVTLLAPVMFVNAGADTDPNGGTQVNVELKNPLGENGPQSIPEFIKALVKIVLVIGVPIVALAIIYTGFLFVQAQGNPEKLNTAKRALIYSLIGAALLLGAYVIAEAIGKTVDEITSTS